MMTPEERQEHYDWHGGGFCATCVVDDGDGHATSAPFPCLPARLLADYDRLVEVAREAVDAWDASVVNGDVEPAIEDLRALIDPATPGADQ